MAENGSVEPGHPGGLTGTPRFTDECLIRLVAEYDRLGGELEALGRLRRSYEKTMREASVSGESVYASVAEYSRRREEAKAARALASEESRRVAQREEEIRRRRVEILEGLYAAGMPPGAWFRHGDEAVLLERKDVPVGERASRNPVSSGDPQHVLRLRRAAWEVVKESPRDTPPKKKLGRRSRGIEAEREAGMSMTPWRRVAGPLGVAGQLVALVLGVTGQVVVAPVLGAYVCAYLFMYQWPFYKEQASYSATGAVSLLLITTLDLMIFGLVWASVAWLAGKVRRLGLCGGW